MQASVMADIERYAPFDGALGISLATRVGSLVYTSGVIGFDGATGTVPENLEDEIVVYPVFQKVRVEVFAGHVPASTSVFVQALVGPQNHCEVKLVAVIPDSN